MNPLKLLLARLADRSGFNRAGLAAQRLRRRPWIRALNYHGIPRGSAEAFEQQVAFYARHFEPVGLEQLRAFLGGAWTPGRPGLVLSFDDGLRSHAEIAAPVLERYGFPGWFSVPAGFPDARPGEHEAFRSEHHVSYDENEYDDRRGVLSWEDVRRLDKNHVVCCHSFTHKRLAADLTDEERHLEIHAAKAKLERELGHAVPVFVWVGGEEWSYSVEAAEEIRKAGFELAFMTNNAPILPGDDPLQLQRTNVEATDPPELVRFSLSGFFDLLYGPKRRRVNRLTALRASRT